MADAKDESRTTASELPDDPALPGLRKIMTRGLAHVRARTGIGDALHAQLCPGFTRNSGGKGGKSSIRHQDLRGRPLR